MHSQSQLERVGLCMKMLISRTANNNNRDLWCEYDEKISNVAQVQNPVIEINRIK